MVVVVEMVVVVVVVVVVGIVGGVVMVGGFAGVGCSGGYCWWCLLFLLFFTISTRFLRGFFVGMKLYFYKRMVKKIG